MDANPEAQKPLVCGGMAGGLQLCAGCPVGPVAALSDGIGLTHCVMAARMAGVALSLPAVLPFSCSAHNSVTIVR